MDQDDREARVNSMAEALSVKRNAAVGAGAGLLLAVTAYLFRVLELGGPFAGTRQFPVLGEAGWFLLLAFVLASSTALLVTSLLTVVSLVRFLQNADPADAAE
jgi:hypothetical protein